MPNLQSEGGSQGTRGRWEKRPMASSAALTASWLGSSPAGLPSSAPHKIKEPLPLQLSHQLCMWGVGSSDLGGCSPGEQGEQVEDMHTPKEFRTGILCPGKQHWFGGGGCPNPLENTSLKHTIKGPGLFKETLGEPWVTKILTPTLPTWGTPKVDHHADQICDCGSSLRLPQPLVVFLRFPQSDSTE